MKAYFFIFVGLIVFAFSACNMDGVSNSQPRITFFQQPVLNGKTTLGGAVITDYYLLDTISVGDTVSFYMYLNAYSNNLVSYTMTQSSDSVTKIILPEVSAMDSLFLSTSNYDKGIFYFSGKANLSFFSFRYVAKKVSSKEKIVFNLVSDANFEYNTSSFVVKTPIVAKNDTVKTN